MDEPARPNSPPCRLAALAPPLLVFFPRAAICGRGHGAELGSDEAARPRSPPHPESELALTMDAPMARCGDENWFPVRSITLSTMLGSIFLL